MSDPLAGLYTDEDVNVLVAELMRRRGFRAAATRDRGRLGICDASQLEYATSQGMAILTHNRGDFEELHRQCIAEERTHAGIIIALTNRPYAIARKVGCLLNRYTADEMRNQLLYV